MLSLTPKPCRLCSQLYSKFSQFLSRLFHRGVDCQGINRAALDPLDQRAKKIQEAAPDCLCEKFRMSAHSPGVVSIQETLARFVFSPLHLDRKGNVKPTLFDQVHSSGCSVQRDSIATTGEITQFVSDFLSEAENRALLGVVSGKCHSVRDIRMGDRSERSVCVYDTAEASNPAHAEMFCARPISMNADRNELRRHLWLAFTNGTIVPPSVYRGGAVLSSLPVELQRSA